MASEAAHRYPPLSVIRTYLDQGLSGVFAVPGEPECQIAIEGPSLIAVRAPAVGRMPDVAGYEHLNVNTLDDGDRSWFELSVPAALDADGVYGVLCAVLDRIQLEGGSFASAVEGAVAALAELLAKRARLSHEQELGLVGELITLRALCQHLGSPQALAAWRGPLGEEHDFGLSNVDLEVKTTLAESRHHWISTVTQLAPTGTRPLVLLSLQLTAAGAASGWTLPSLIGELHNEGNMPVQQLDQALSEIGYSPNDADLFRSKWRLRAAPAFFLVDDSFPALTPARVSGVVPVPSRILQIRYQIDLTGLTPMAPPFPLLDGELGCP